MIFFHVSSGIRRGFLSISFWGQKGHSASHPMIDSICMYLGFFGNLYLSVTSSLSGVDIFLYQVHAARRGAAASSDESRRFLAQGIEKGAVAQERSRLARELFG